MLSLAQNPILLRTLELPFREFFCFKSDLDKFPTFGYTTPIIYVGLLTLQKAITTPYSIMATGKRIAAAKALVDKTKIYSVDEAIALVKQTSTVKFVASVEVHAQLGIDPAKSDQQIRTTVSLPHGTGKTKKNAAFVGPNNEKAAQEAGADFVYGEEDIKKIKDGLLKIDFDVAVATPEMMPKMAVAAKVFSRYT